MSETDPPGGSSKSSVPPANEPPYIMVVDDDDDVREAICMTLLSDGFSIRSASNGREAFARIHKTPPLLVLCDVRMPVMDGYETLALLRASEATAHVPFVFLSGHADLQEVRRGMNLGADDYLVKPFTSTDLLTVIRARLKRSSMKVPAYRTTTLVQAIVDADLEGVPRELIAERYRLLRCVRRGSMGAVYAAHDVVLDLTVAMKLMPDGASAARFHRECMILSKLRHPRIIQYRDRGISPDGIPFLVMDWLDGSDLRARIRRETLSVEDGVLVLRNAAEALAAVHAAGVVHRDIKPSNFLLHGSEVAGLTLIDFGVSVTSEISEITAPGDMLGTFGFFAPELVEGSHAADARSDVFSLGCTVYACFTGASPYTGSTLLESLARLFTNAPPSVRAERPEVPASIDALLRAMLDPDPARRPTDGLSVLRALDALS